MYRFIKGTGIFLSRLSPARLEQAARVLAVLSFDLLRFRRRLILANLAVAFGAEKSQAERVRIGRASMMHFFLTVFEFLRSVRQDILGDTVVEGVEHVTRALEEGRGGYILCCHLGNWEAMGGAGTRFAVPTYSLVKEMRQGGVDRLVDELRRKNGLYPIYRKPAGAAIKQIRQTLKRNELVGFVLDQARPRTPKVPFFGKPAKTQTSLATLWRKHPAPIIPVSIRRVSAGKHVVTAWPPLNVEGRGERLTEQCNEMIEQMIRTCPDQYFWLHDRWK